MMSSLSIFLVLATASSLAVLFSTPKQLSALKTAGIHIPAPPRLIIIQGIVLALIGVGLGTALRGRTGFRIVNSNPILPTLLATFIGAVGHLVLYYLIFRPRIPRRAIRLGEQIRLEMGLPARILQGGITEEVQFRWGVMSGAAALTLLIFPNAVVMAMPVAIVLSACFFALFHLFGAYQNGLAGSRMETALILVNNTWGGLIFGWLFWNYGLLVAMFAHAGLHTLWFPIERWTYQQEGARDEIED